MKTKITVLVVVFCSVLFPVRGSTVVVSDAQKVAENFFKIVTQQTVVPWTPTLQYVRIEGDGTVSLYVFDMAPHKGFVIVSASDNTTPIIGYSTESDFPTNFSATGLNEWIGLWGQEIAYVENNHIAADSKNAGLWYCYRQGMIPVTSRALGVGPLCSTAWNQSGVAGALPALYNEDCPYDNRAGTNTLTGCVATAMAQIMKYWNYPARGTGIATYDDVTANGFSNNYGQLTFNFNTTPFNWSDMPNTITGNSTAAQDSAVSLLNYACGVSVQMDYGPAESNAWVLASESTDGASSQQAYSLYFKYNPNTIRAVRYSNYTVAAWISLIENELNAGRPVQYQGYDSLGQGAHTWVCDGYNASDMLHMNWGFGGQFNGWYAVTDLHPSYNFTYDLAALIGIEPDVEAKAMPSVLCAGDTSILMVTGAPSVANYLWTPSTGLSCTTCASPKASPSATTTYTGHVDSAGSSFTVAVTVYVNHRGKLNYTLSDSEICNGNSATLSFTGESGISFTPVSSVSWQDSLLALLTPDSTTAYLVASESTVCGTRDSAEVTVHVTQHSAITLNLSSNIICHGSNATLSYTGLSDVSVNPVGYSYSTADNILVFNPSSTTQFTVTGSTSCGSVFTDTFTIAVTPDTGALSFTLSKPTICRGDTSLLTVTQATGVQVTPANKVTSIGNNTFLLIPDSNTVFYVSGYSAGCGGQATAEVPVKVIQANSINYSVSNQDLCVGGYEYIYLYGVTGNIQSDPPLYFYLSDSADAYAYFVADSTTTYTISATTICGVTGTTNAEVRVLPPVVYNLERGTVCQGDSTLFAALGLTGIGIYPATGFRMIDSFNYEFHPTQTTNYTLGGYDCTGAYNSYSFTINVAQPGVFNYTLQDSDLCSVFGTEVKLNGVYNPQINPSGYLNMADSVDYYATLNPPVTTTYNISGQSVCGGTVSSSFTVYVFPKTGFSLGTHAVCPGGSTTLKITGLAEPVIFPDNTVSWINDTTARLSPTVETDYELSGADCTGKEVQFNFIVGVLPGNDLIYSVDSELCSGNNSYLNISGASNISIMPTVNLTYTDSFDAYAYLAPDVTTRYTLIGKSECTNAADTDVFNVYIVETPSYSLSSQTICSGDSAIVETFGLNGIAINPSTNVSYINANEAYLYPTITTTYTLTGNSSCTNAYYGKSFTLTVDSALLGEQLNISQSHDTLFAANAGSYQWLLNNSPIPGANGSFIIPVSGGIYTVELGGANNCRQLSNVFVYTGINDLTGAPDYKVYPNPSSGRWTIQASAPGLANTCEIFDNVGRLVYRSAITGTTYEVGADLSPGIYLMKLSGSGQAVFIVKLIKV